MSYIPAAAHTVTSSGVPHACPECGEEHGSLYGLMGSGDPLLCGRCFDDRAFEGKPELRARCEAKRNEILAWFMGGVH